MGILSFYRLTITVIRVVADDCVIVRVCVCVCVYFSIEFVRFGAHSWRNRSAFESVLMALPGARAIVQYRCERMLHQLFKQTYKVW